MNNMPGTFFSIYKLLHLIFTSPPCEKDIIILKQSSVIFTFKFNIDYIGEVLFNLGSNYLKY